MSCARTFAPIEYPAFDAKFEQRLLSGRAAAHGLEGIVVEIVVQIA